MKKASVPLALAVVIALSGCGTRSAAKEWQIPFLDSLTGPIAGIGEYLLWSAQRAASEINQGGGIAGKQVRIVPVDTGIDPQKGSVEMARIVKDSLVALGPVPEAVIMAAMPIAVEAGMMSFTATTSLEYAEKYFPWSISWFPPTEALAKVAAEWVRQYPGVKKAIQFVEPYGPWPGMAAAHANGLEGAGVTVLSNVDVPSDAVTFGPLAVRALSQKPDAILISCNPEKIPKIIRELKNRGWTAMDRILIFSSGDAPELYAVGGSDIDGVEIYNYIDPNVNTPRWNAFKDAYMKDHNGELPPSLSTNYYDAVYMIKEAIEKTGVTGEPSKLKEERRKIAEFCADVKDFKGILFSWDVNADIPTNKPAYIFRIQSGKKIMVKEVRL